MISEDKINEVVTKITTGFNPEKIILFGSYAAENSTPDSDMDLLIIQETDLPRQKRSFDIQKALIGSMIPMDILIYNRTEFEKEKNEKFSYLSSAMKTSKVVYGRTN